MSDDDFVIQDNDASNLAEQHTNKQQPQDPKNQIEKQVIEPQFDKVPACLLFVGKPKRGKSNAVKYFLLKNLLEGKFKFGIVFTRTKYSKEYDYLPEKYVYTGFQQDILEKYLSGMEKMLEEDKDIPPNFVVFDDLLGLLSKTNPTLLNFFACHRHTNTSVFLCTQHLKSGASTTLREITTHAFLFNTKTKNTLEALFECFGQLFDNFDEFKNYFFDLTAEQYVCMLYSQDVDDIDENYVAFQAPDMSQYKDINIEY